MFPERVGIELLRCTVEDRLGNSLGKQLVGKLGKPVFNGRIEIANSFEECERDDAMHHGAQT